MPLVGGNQGTAFETLLQQVVSDGMILRRVTVPMHEVVYFKSVLEAYPGLAAVHAERADKKTANATAAERKAHLVVATTAGFELELDALLGDLSQEMTLAIS